MSLTYVRIASIVLGAVALCADSSAAQSIEWGVKAGINRSSVGGVTDYYDWVLCCEPGRPDATVDASAGTGVTGGGFVAFPLGRRLALQGELLMSRRRHGVDLEPYEPIEVTFTRDYVEAAGLLKLQIPLSSVNHAYVAAGPVFGFKVGEQADSSDPRLVRGNPETDVYVVQIQAYAAPELLRTAQTSVAVAGGLVIRRLLVEVRFTQGLHSIFKDRSGLLEGFVSVGGDRETVDRLLPQFEPFLESARPRDVSLVLGVRF